MTALAGMTTFGDQRRHKARVGRVARHAVCFVCCFVMLMTVMFVMAAFVTGHNGDSMRHALAPTSTVARVQAAAEGEVNHRGDSCDDADQRSHGRCLCYPLLSIHLPRKLKFENGMRLFTRRYSLARASGLHVPPSSSKPAAQAREYGRPGTRKHASRLNWPRFGG